jgi:hypothetical protein
LRIARRKRGGSADGLSVAHLKTCTAVLAGAARLYAI